MRDERDDVMEWLQIGAMGEARRDEGLSLRQASALVDNWVDTGSTERIAEPLEAVHYTRKNLHDLTGTEHTALARAFAGLNTRTSPTWGRYVFLHRVMRRHAHGTLRFLPWHRIMVWRFEQRLRAVDATVSVPYWTWWHDASTGRKGIPAFWAAFAPPVWYPNVRLGDLDFLRVIGVFLRRDVAGDVFGLTRAEMLELLVGALSSGRRSIAGTQLAVTRASIMALIGGAATSRRTLPTQAQTRAALSESSFASFSSAFERLHGGPHMWVGDNGRSDGRMADLEFSPSDPIFFFHHCEVDRLWSLRQATRPDTRPSFTGRDMPPWNETLADAWTIGSSPLDFAYANASVDDALTP